MISSSRCFGVCFCCFLLLLTCRTIRAQDQQHVLILQGAPGTDEYGQLFTQCKERWQSAAAAGEATCCVIGDDSGDNDLTDLETELSRLATITTTEPLWLVLIGHGTHDGRVSRFNARGPDVTASRLKELLEPVHRPIAIINCSSCSAPFINALSGPDRVVVTATKDGREFQFSRFGKYISEAIVGLDADVDRDGQTSLLEAWLFAARRTAEFYESEGRLATEHSLLDDTGDALGTRFEVFEGVRVRDNVPNSGKLDGRLAHRWHLVRSEDERRLTPEQRRQRDALELQLEQLRNRKSSFQEVEYLSELERILLPLARLYEDADTSSN